MRRRLALTAVGLAEKVDRFLASEMGWSEDVCSVDASGPDGLSGVKVSSRKQVAETADDSASERKGTFADGIGNRECPTRHLDPCTL